MKSFLKISPVDNGDHSMIKLEDKTTIQIDCNIRDGSIGSSDPKVFDVKKDLLNSVEKRDGNPFVDVFILTHGDCDHCRGYKKNFYQGDPKNYAKANRENGEIIIDEIWFSPMIAEEHTNDDEDAYQQEAERRLELHRNGDPDRNLPGNRVKIVGYDGNKDYSDLDYLRATPGTIVDTFNNKRQAKFSLFIHAPFKEHLMEYEKDKNSASIVFQARFSNSYATDDFVLLAMFGGDSDHRSWAIILDKTRKHNNEIALYWDVFIAPHHCSWSFFNERPYIEFPEPMETSLEVLDYKRINGQVVASSKEIFDDDDNPPHYSAKEEYLKKLDSESDFLNTATIPSNGAPKPIIFEIDDFGFARIDKKIAAAATVAGAGLIQKPWAK